MTIETGEPRPGVTEVRIHGDVDLASGRHLKRELEAAVATGGGVVVNLFGCTFLDSSGLNALMSTARGVPDPRRFAVLCLPGGTVRHVFSLTRAHTLLELHADRDAALAAVAG